VTNCPKVQRAVFEQFPTLGRYVTKKGAAGASPLVDAATTKIALGVFWTFQYDSAD
jgi:hypothetical protein